MELFLEVILQVVVEVIAPFLIEILLELGLRKAFPSWGLNAPKHPIFSIFGYLITAWACATASLMFFPNHFIHSPQLRLISLILSPVVIGFLMSRRGRFLVRKQKEPIRLDSFFYGFLFALTFSLIRFFYALN